MSLLAVLLLFMGISVIAFIFFVVCLVRFCMAKHQIKTQPDSISENEMKNRKILLIVSSFIIVVLLAVIIGFIVLLYSSLTYM